MSDLTDFQNDQIVGAQLWLATQRDKTSSAKQNSGQKEKPGERDRRVLKQIVMSKK